MTTSIAVESAVRSYLRVSDVLNCVLEGRAIQHGPNEEASAVVDQEDNPSAGRVLAIVTSNAAENAEVYSFSLVLRSMKTGHHWVPLPRSKYLS